MVPGMVQDGSDMVPQRADATKVYYLYWLAMCIDVDFGRYLITDASVQ